MAIVRNKFEAEFERDAQWMRERIKRLKVAPSTTEEHLWAARAERMMDYYEELIGDYHFEEENDGEEE